MKKQKIQGIQKKLTALMLTVMLAVIISGCGKKAEEAETKAVAETEVVKETEEAKPSEGKEEPAKEKPEEKKEGEEEKTAGANLASGPSEIICKENSYSVYVGVIGEKHAQIVLTYAEGAGPESEAPKIRVIVVMDGEEKAYLADGGDLKKLEVSEGSVEMILTGEAEDKGDGITGTYSTDGGKNKQEFYASLAHVSGDTAKEEERKEMEAFAAKVKTAVLEKDIESLSDMVVYPFSIKILGQEKEFKDKKAFLAYDFEALYTDSFVKDIEEESCFYMFQNTEGTMMGTGQIWLGFIKDDKEKEVVPKIIAMSCWN